jgi:hypothetical protein
MLTEQVVISCIGPIWRPLASDSLDIAYRLLILSANLPNRVRHWLGYRNTPTGSKGSFIKFQPNPGFAWWERRREWWRWVAPVTKEENISMELGDKAQSSLESSNDINIPPVDLDSSEAASIESDISDPKHSVSKTAVYWSPNYITESSALIGTILHSVSPSSAVTLQSLKPADLFHRADQKFDSATPNFSHLVNSKDARKVHDPVQSIIMRLVPDPLEEGKGPGSQVLTAYPSIEMHFSIDPTTKNAKVEAVQAVVSTENSDLMLPNSSVDVRFQQNIRSQLRRPKSGDAYPKSVRDFINNSNLNIENARYIETPPRVKIPIDRHLCRSSTSIDMNENDEIKEVSYMFAGLEIHNTVAMEFDDWVMTYTSIQAGKANGRRSELRLRPTAIKSSKLARSEDDFTRSVFRLIEALDTAKVPLQISNYVTKADRNLAHQYLSSDRRGLRDSKYRLQSRKASRDGVVRFLAKRIGIRTEIERQHEMQKNQSQHAFWELQQGVASEPIAGSEDEEEDELMQEIKKPEYSSKMEIEQRRAQIAVWKPGMKITTKAHVKARDKHCDENKLCYECFSPGHSSFECPKRMRSIRRTVPGAAKVIAREAAPSDSLFEQDERPDE